MKNAQNYELALSRETDAAFVIQQLDCRNITHLSVPGDDYPNEMRLLRRA